MVIIGACASVVPHFFSNRDELHGRGEFNALNAMVKLVAQRETSAGQIHTHVYTLTFKERLSTCALGKGVCLDRGFAERLRRYAGGACGLRRQLASAPFWGHHPPPKGPVGGGVSARACSGAATLPVCPRFFGQCLFFPWRVPPSWDGVNQIRFLAFAVSPVPERRARRTSGLLLSAVRPLSSLSLGRLWDVCSSPIRRSPSGGGGCLSARVSAVPCSGLPSA